MTWGDVVKRIYWILVSCLFGTVLLTALPRVDAPDTAFNETDAPVVVSYPALPRLRSLAPFILANSLPEVSASALVPDFNHRAPRFKSAREVQGSGNLQPLLCTFLI